LPIGKGKLNVFLFLFLFSQSLAQVWLGGFGRTQEIASIKGFKRLAVCDFNEDGNSDFILYGVNKKEIIIHRSKEDGSLRRPRKKFFFYPITEIKKLNKRKDFGSFYVVLSKPEKRAALVTFTKYGTLQLLNIKKFHSYPSYLETGDTDGDGKNEALVCGGNFDGLSLLREKDFVLKETKIVSGVSFVKAKIIDFNYDGYPDIVAYSKLNGEMFFLKNDADGNFVKIRNFPLFAEARDFDFYDFDKDGFQDMIIFRKNSFVVFKGDSVSSFGERRNYDFNFSVGIWKLTDVNDDGETDILMGADSNRTLFCSLGKKGHFSSPFQIDGNVSVQDIFIRSPQSDSSQIFVYGKDGVIYKYLNSKEMPSDFFLVSPFKISAFDICADKHFFLKALDTARGKEALFYGKNPRELFLKTRFETVHNHAFRCFESSVSTVTINFALSNSVVAVSSFNVLNGKETSSFSLFDGKIMDLQVFNWTKKLAHLVAVLIADSTDSLHLKGFYIKKGKIFEPNLNLKANIVPPRLNNARMPKIIVWRDSLTDKIIKEKTGVDYSESKADITVTLPSAFQIPEEKQKPPFMKNGKIYFEGKDNKVRSFYFRKTSRLKETNNFRTSYLFDKYKQFFFVSSENSRTLHIVAFDEKKGKFKHSTLIESFPINRYFVARFGENIYAVLFDAKKGKIKFEKIEN